MKIVGIVPKILIVSNGPFLGSTMVLVNSDYCELVMKAGGVPILFPLTKDETVLKEIIKSVDGVIISGGDDINPLRYNKEPLSLLGNVNDNKDIIDLKVIEFAIKENKSILGICRGCQAINVYFGGTLYQDISYNNGAFLNHDQKNNKENPSHSINICNDSFLYDVYGDIGMVNSFHHQCIKDVGKNLKITATAKDGVVEAIEYEGNKLIIGVQWHPELMIDKDESISLMKKFINKL